MSQRIERLAELSVARGCGFAGLAIFTFMVGLAGNMKVSLVSGGVMCLMTCFVLLLKSIHIERTSYKRTELWIMLEPEERPAKAFAQKVIVAALQAVYLKFALRSAWMSAVLLMLAVVAGSADPAAAE